VPPSPAVSGLLRDLGPRLRCGELPAELPSRLPTGLPQIDQLLGGGFPRGRLSEICGALSSGRTSLTLALLAETTRAGELCAVVDAADGLDPLAAEAAGIALPRVLWVRAAALHPALNATQQLLEAGGFALVVLHLANPSLRTSLSSWRKLARSAAGARTALVLLGLDRSAGTAAEITLELRGTRAHFTGHPPLLEALEVEAQLLRHRTAPAQRSARVRLQCSA